MSIISNMVANLFYPLDEIEYNYIDDDEPTIEKNSKRRFITLINEAFGFINSLFLIIV